MKWKNILVAAAFSTLLFLVSSTQTSFAGSTTGCFAKGIYLAGKVKLVENFPDLKVQIVKNFPDVKVQFVSSFPGVPK